MTTSGSIDESTIATDSLQLQNGLEIAYYDSKEDHGLPYTLVLLHGYCGSSAYWDKVVGNIASTVRVIAPDARGHGSSSAPNDETYSMELFAEDLSQLLDHLGVTNAIVLGHSLGGYITLAFADKYSNSLSAFGLIHSTPLPDGETAKENRDKAIAAIGQKGVATFVDGLVPKLFATDRIDGLQPELARSKEIGYGTSQHGAVATARGMKERMDRSDIIKGSKLPILLVAGAKDNVIPAVSTFSANNDDTRKVELEEAGHMSMMECGHQLSEEILSFIRSV
ncbi:alpha/beta hydrolase [Paenibacillus sp. GSMTC-2017]|uniref:alpha/beta fold hydrolase n=1 Tax=Paenibacillus sp. GSMTC-2017 TaxID=2794350 RepID=UPI0018D767C4|nr:alpha/beta hydrolase [Paenibacillus sp. GSMTC-2017]MBH5320015.1 alpha/beta hydrolase [Paenibacillus sp. GSMTC-2017]